MRTDQTFILVALLREDAPHIKSSIMIGIERVVGASADGALAALRLSAPEHHNSSRALKCLKIMRIYGSVSLLDRQWRRGKQVT